MYSCISYNTTSNETLSVYNVHIGMQWSLYGQQQSSLTDITGVRQVTPLPHQSPIPFSGRTKQFEEIVLSGKPSPCILIAEIDISLI